MFTSSSQSKYVYLKGVSKDNLSLILDFIYQGSVNVSKSSINGFLKDAHELQIQGLKSDIDPKDSIAVGKSMADNIPSNQISPKALKKRTLNAFDESVRKNGVANDSLATSCRGNEDGILKSSKGNKKAILEQENKENMNISMQSENDAKLSDLNNSQPSGLKKPVTQEERSRIKEVFEKLGRDNSKPGKRRYLVRCSICSKEMRADSKLS